LPRTALLLAGLGAALLFGGLSVARGHALPAAGEPPWVEQHVAEVVPGQPYRLDACFTVTKTGLRFVALRVVWYSEPNGFGSSSLVESPSTADPWLLNREQCLVLSADAPCPARSVRYGVIAVEDTTSVTVSSLQLSFDPAGTPELCPTPTPLPTPTPAPTLPATPAPSPTPQPPPGATPTPETAAEPAFFPSLVNGGFEQLRADGTPYGWRKVGGEMATAAAVRYQGLRAAALTSRTESTKWLFQTVGVRGGSYYRLRAMALKSGAAVQETLLRVSWYASADGSGAQLATADSQPLTADSPRFAGLDTGPVQAPAEARSARVRLLLRPTSSAPATAYFDDVSFVATASPPAGDGPPAQEAEGSAAADGQRPDAATARRAVAGTRSGPAPLANVGKLENERAPADGSGNRPLWPALLALAIPAGGLALTAAHGWRVHRAGAANKRHL